MRSIICTLLAEMQVDKSFHGKMRANGICKLTKNMVIGNNVNFNGIKIHGKGKITIGDNFHSGKNCRVITSTHNYNGEKIPYDTTYVHKDVVIEDNVWVGIDVIILGGVKIGEGAIIQAGSVVVTDILALAIAGGHPARVFSHRNSEHYDKLKRLGRFH
ncbi:MAG: acyltransferase [Ginsengibacter sp.]